MGESLFSSSWYRVAELRPRLRRHARMRRHLYRGRVWYVLDDTANQRVHRFSTETYSIIGLMDGTRTVSEIWDLSMEMLGDAAPTQDEMIRLLSQLHMSDVLQTDVPPDALETLERYQRQEKQELQGRLLSPFAIKIPLLDPDRILVRGLPYLRRIANVWGLVAWLAVVLPAVVLAAMHWGELTEGLIDRLLAPQNLFLIWLLFPVIKVLHEFGHGFAARLFGGEVHDMGVMLLVFTPVPYVDASSASAIPDKRKRALVAGAGMLVEVFIAALALYTWLAVEPGAVRTLAYNAMIIGGITTLTFNANPLLRFDGYYILADWIEIPNLRQRANHYVGFLLEHHLLRSPDALDPELTSGEAPWLVGYAVLAFIYRLFVVAFILLFVLELSFELGILLIAVSAISWFIMPLWKGMKFLFSNPRIARVRSRAIGWAAAVVITLLALLFVIPLPHWTLADGVVWVPERAIVRAGTSCFIQEVVATSGTRVVPGQLLLRCHDSQVATEVEVLQARLRGLRAREQKARQSDLPRAQLLEEEAAQLERRMTRAVERRAEFEIRADTAGIFVIESTVDLPGRFVSQGELIAYVLDIDSVRVRAVVPQEDLELIRDRLESIEARYAHELDRVLTGRLVRLSPSASEELPAAALGSLGGGEIAIDPRMEAGTLAVAPFFEIEIDLDDAERLVFAGGRVYLRFNYGTEPIAYRTYRSLRQLFLSRLDV